MEKKDIFELSIPLIVLASIFVIFFISKILENHLYKYKRLEVLLRHLYVPLQIILVSAFAYLIFKTLTVHLSPDPILDKIYMISLIIGFGCLAIKSLNVFTSMVLQFHEIQAKNNYHIRMIYTRLDVVKGLAKSVIIAMVVVCVLMTFETIRSQGINILASAGVMSIIVGLAAQKTMGNFFAGLQIAIAQPIRVDDVVVLENECGSIEEIHMTYVVVKLWDLRRMLVPISYFTDHPFQNWTQKTADLLAPVDLYVDYAMPIEPIRKEVDRILEESKLWDRRVKKVQVTDVFEHAMKVRILVSASNAGQAFDLRCDIREQLMTFLQKNHPHSLPRVRTELTEETSNNKN